MRNENIKPGDVVPVHIRIECYKELIRQIEAKDYKHGTHGICLSLPCILWDLDGFLDDAPNGGMWFSYSALIMFPELKKDHIDRLNKIESEVYKNKERVRLLNQYIKQLSQTP